MFRTLDCIANHHHPWLLALAVLVCLAAAMTTVRAFGYARAAPAPRRRPWLIVAGVIGGAGIWATHFVSMLAFDPGLPTGYEPTGTLASLLLAMAGVFGALHVAASVRRPIAAAGGGGMLLATAIAAMHDTGMYAFRTTGTLSWSAEYLVSALGLGMLFSSLALFLALDRRRHWGRDGAAAGLFVLAIVCVHFISMAAVTITPDGRRTIPASLIPNGAMAIAVGVLAGMLMLAAVVTVALEARNQRRSRQRLNGIMAAMADGLAYLDAEDRFVLWNGRYEDALSPFNLKPVRGHTYAQCILEPAARTGVFEGASDPDWLGQRKAERRAGPSSREEYTPDGRWFRVIENATADGGWLISVVDITALKQAAADLAIARDEAEAANKAKSAFLANMSHEIRTPLNGVMGVADALALTTLSEDQAELVEIIRGSGGTLNRLLCDILDLARVESGALEVTSEPFHLGDAIRDVAHLCAPRASGTRVAFEVQVDPAAERWVTGDATRVKQVVTNLVSNAFKFTAAGRVELMASGAGEGRYRISVSDTGPGFDEATRQRLFSRFQQGDGSITRRFGGSGLGLSISRELVELMGGAVSVQSTEGAGSCFTVELPLAPAESPAPQPDVIAAAPAGRPLRVLVVDDHPNNRRLLEVLLAHLGADCVTAEDGAAGVEAWRAGGFDAVLMDMQMPVMDGLEATRRIRALETTMARPRTPIVMVSANAMPEHLAAGQAAGADSHLSKPLSAERLFAALSELESTGDRVAA